MYFGTRLLFPHNELSSITGIFSSKQEKVVPKFGKRQKISVGVQSLRGPCTRMRWQPIKRTGRHDVAGTRPQHQSCSGLALHPGLTRLGFLPHSHHAVARVVTCALVRDHVLLRHFAS